MDKINSQMDRPCFLGEVIGRFFDCSMINSSASKFTKSLGTEGGALALVDQFGEVRLLSSPP